MEKLKTVPGDLGKLINVVNNDIVKKTVYDKLVSKVIYLWNQHRGVTESNVEDKGIKMQTYVDA